MEVFHPDFIDFIRALNRSEVRYLLVGGYAVILHGYFRSTGDLDIWVNPTEDNFEKLALAMREFGLPSAAISRKDFLNTAGTDVFTFGRSPVSIDILTAVKGLDFEASWTSAQKIHTQGIDVRIISLDTLIKAKQHASRYKDLDDIRHLQKEEE